MKFVFVFIQRFRYGLRCGEGIKWGWSSYFASYFSKTFSSRAHAA